jgi:hypothetical protein
MDLKQSCNVFLPVKQYGEIKELSHRLSIPYSELIREGVSLVLKKYQRKHKSRNKIPELSNDY